jgi:hypothetical protein
MIRTHNRRPVADTLPAICGQIEAAVASSLALAESKQTDIHALPAFAQFLEQQARRLRRAGDGLRGGRQQTWIDLSGMRFGKLTILSPKDKSGGKQRWNALCDCGNTSTPLTPSLKRGLTNSCGCLRYIKGRKRGRKLYGVNAHRNPKPSTEPVTGDTGQETGWKAIRCW